MALADINYQEQMSNHYNELNGMVNDATGNVMNALGVSESDFNGLKATLQAHIGHAEEILNAPALASASLTTFKKGYAMFQNQGKSKEDGGAEAEEEEGVGDDVGLGEDTMNLTNVFGGNVTGMLGRIMTNRPLIGGEENPFSFDAGEAEEGGEVGEAGIHLPDLDLSAEPPIYGEASGGSMEGGDFGVMGGQYARIGFTGGGEATETSFMAQHHADDEEEEEGMETEVHDTTPVDTEPNIPTELPESQRTTIDANTENQALNQEPQHRGAEGDEDDGIEDGAEEGVEEGAGEGLAEMSGLELLGSALGPVGILAGVGLGLADLFHAFKKHTGTDPAQQSIAQGTLDSVSTYGQQIGTATDMITAGAS